MMLVTVLGRSRKYGTDVTREAQGEVSVHKAKCKEGRKRFMMWQEDQKCDAVNNAKSMIKTNQGITGKLCIRNDDDVLKFSDENKKAAWKDWEAREAVERILCRDSSFLSQADAFRTVPCLINVDIS